MMAHTLYTSISTSYENTTHFGKFDSTQAWNITSSFVKQIFSEIGYARVSASYIIKTDAPWSSVAGVIFATLKSHSVMIKFMNFPSKIIQVFPRRW